MTSRTCDGWKYRRHASRLCLACAALWSRLYSSSVRSSNDWMPRETRLMPACWSTEAYSEGGGGQWEHLPIPTFSKKGNTLKIGKKLNSNLRHFWNLKKKNNLRICTSNARFLNTPLPDGAQAVHHVSRIALQADLNAFVRVVNVPGHREEINVHFNTLVAFRFLP